MCHARKKLAGLYFHQISLFQAFDYLKNIATTKPITTTTTTERERERERAIYRELKAGLRLLLDQMWG